MSHAYEFYVDFCSRLTLPPALPASEWAAYPNPIRQYFETRGILPEIVQEAGVIPLTPCPTREENEAYKACLHQSRYRHSQDKTQNSGSPDPIVWGILFPYDLSYSKEDFGTFGTARALQLTESFQNHYLKKGEKVPKMVGPRKGHVTSASHLYILPSEQGKLKKTDVDFILIEGQAKTLKLIQDLRTAGLSEQFCVIGLQGVEQFLSAPGTHLIQWRNRGVYIFFDADSVRKHQVAQAEIKAAAFCLSKGAKYVKSPSWKEERGNGYDDHSVFAASKGFPVAQNLPRLIQKAKETFEKYAPDDDAMGIPVETMCRAIAKVPQLQKHQRTLLLKRVERFYKRVGLKAKEIESVFEAQIEHVRAEQQEQKIKENGEVFKEFFDLPYVPDIPENYHFDRGQIRHMDTHLCKAFVIRKYISTEDVDADDFYLLAFKNKDILLSSADFTNYRKIAEMLNRNQELLYDTSARAVQEYIAKYWHKNRYKPIPVVPFHENTGWDKTGVFRIPTRDADGEYSAMIKRAIQCDGDPEEQKRFIRWVMQHQGAALAYMLGFVTPLLGLFNLPQMIVMIYGNPGDGKSTAAFAALSLYGRWKYMYQSMNATKVGKEVSCALAKDIPICFDELNTAGNGDGKVLAQELVSTIYEFYSGKGRTRSNKSITLSKQNEYQGLMMLTSERSLETIFSVMSNMNIGGAYRRTLEIPVLTEQSLWNEEHSFSNTPNQKRSDFFGDVYESINTHYGYVGAEWVDYISEPSVQLAIKEEYKTYLSVLGKMGVELKGTEHLIALIYGASSFVDTFLGLEPGTTEKTIDDILKLTMTQQQTQIDRQVRDGVEKFVEALNSFISSYPLTFEGVCPPNTPMSKVYGKVLDSPPDKDGHVWRTVFLRPEALKDLCNLYGMDRNGVLVKLKESGIFKPWPLTRHGKTIEKDYKSMRINQTSGDVYRFVIPGSAEYEDEDLVDPKADPEVKKSEREEKAKKESAAF